MLSRVLTKLYHVLRYPHHTPQAIGVVTLRLLLRRWRPLYIRPRDLQLGHPVALNWYLFDRLFTNQPKSKGGPIRTYRGKVLDGNGRVCALQITQPDKYIMVLEGDWR